jgi:hypothetical protein
MFALAVLIAGVAVDCEWLALAVLWLAVVVAGHSA